MTITKEQALDWLERMAAIQELTIELCEETKGNVFCMVPVRKLFLETKFFFEFCMANGIEFVVKDRDDDRYKFEAKAGLELNGIDYTIFTIYNEGDDYESSCFNG